MYILTEQFLEENIIKLDIETITIVSNNIQSYYEKIKIPKANGTRTVYCIREDSDLYIIQKNIQKNFLSRIALPMCVKGFCKETSYMDFLKEHQNSKYFMRIDIKDFFDSISQEQIIENLSEFIKVGYEVDLLTRLCTYDGKLPQGAITSPSISNIVFRRIDQRITKYCQCLNIKYTRYADDLLFSSNTIDFENEKWFYKKVKYILKENGFLINVRKTHFEKDKLALNGFVLNTELSISRKKIKNINKIIYYFKDKNSEKFKIDKSITKDNYLGEINNLNITGKKFETQNQLVNYLCGYRSFLIEFVHINQCDKNRKMKQIINKINQIQKIIDWIES